MGWNAALHKRRGGTCAHAQHRSVSHDPTRLDFLPAGQRWLLHRAAADVGRHRRAYGLYDRRTTSGGGLHPWPSGVPTCVVALRDRQTPRKSRKYSGWWSSAVLTALPGRCDCRAGKLPPRRRSALHAGRAARRLAHVYRSGLSLGLIARSDMLADPHLHVPRRPLLGVDRRDVLRTCRQHDEQIHLGAENHPVAGPGCR